MIITQNEKICQDIDKEKIKKNFLNNTEKELNKGKNSFKAKKIENMRIAKMIEFKNIKISENLKECANIIATYYNTKTNEKTIIPSSCNQRLCPICDWRKTKKIFYNVLRIINEQEFKSQKFIFITLTIKNCTAEELETTITKMQKSFRSITKNKTSILKQSLTGWFKALEITYNKKNNTYHPHFHILASVKADYFQKSNKRYLTQEKLCQIWQKALKIDYTPLCSIEAVKESENKNAVCEVAKYSVKSADIKTAEIFETLKKALFKRRLAEYGGLFKQVKAKLKLEDEINPNEKINLKELNANENIIKGLFSWQLGAYKITKK